VSYAKQQFSKTALFCCVLTPQLFLADGGGGRSMLGQALELLVPVSISLPAAYHRVAPPCCVTRLGFAEVWTAPSMVGNSSVSIIEERVTPETTLRQFVAAAQPLPFRATLHVSYARGCHNGQVAITSTTTTYAGRSFSAIQSTALVRGVAVTATYTRPAGVTLSKEVVKAILNFCVVSSNQTVQAPGQFSRAALPGSFKNIG